MNSNSETSGLSKSARAFGVALAVASVANALLVVIKEKSPALQADMKNLTGHHWITHVVVILALFLFSGWICSRLNLRFTTGKLIATLVSGVALAGAIILGFYLIAD